MSNNLNSDIINLLMKRMEIFLSKTKPNQFEEIYKEYYPGIYRFLFKLSGEEDLAEELAQETFLQAFKSLYKFKGQCAIFTWLAAIGKHTYYQYLRKKKLGIETINLDYVTDAYLATSLGAPEDELKRKSVSQAVHKVVNEIPDKYRDVIILRTYGEMPFSQVAAALGISESSAKVIFFRAKKMLKEELQHEIEL